MNYKQGTDKKARSLFPMSLADQISENNICRVIYAFVEQLDMKKLNFKYSECKDRGDRPYDPRMLLCLYIYGYLHRIRSSRRLEAETHRNIEVMWLMNELTPDDKTICNFRKDNISGLTAVFREFSILCKNLNLFGGKITATDSTKFRANNSRQNNHNKATVNKKLSSINKRISEYMNILEESDSSQTDEVMPTTDEIKAILENLNARKEKLETFAHCLETASEISTVDPDARLMRSGGDARPLDVCYNVQTIVDSKNNLIVDFAISTCPDDKGNLFKMTEKAKEVMGVDTFVNLADRGYYDGEDIVACEDNGVICLVLKPKSGGGSQSKDFKKERFIYDREKNCYICPLGNELSFKGEEKRDGKDYFVYFNFSACNECALKSECTRAKYRKISRVSYQDKLDIVDKRTANNRKLYLKRYEIIEHVFGTIKGVWGFKQYLCRSKPKVSAETSLTYLCYNFRRVFNIYGGDVKKLVGAMKAYSSFFFDFSLKMDIFQKIFIFLRNLKNKKMRLQFNR